MMFKCKHPFSRLGVQKEQTVKADDEDFEHVTYHLFCRKCGDQVDLVHAKTIGGVGAFFDRHLAKQEKS